MPKGHNQAPPENSLTDEERMALVESQKGYAINYTRKWDLPWCSVGDKVHEAITALGIAAMRFDPNKGVKFTTYAMYYVRAAMMDLAKFCESHGFTELGGARPMRHGPRSEYRGGEETWLSRTFDDPSETGEQAALAKAHFDELVGYSRPRCRKVLRGIYKDGLTLREIGAKLGVCRERVRQLHLDALLDIKRAVANGRVPSLKEFAC